MQLFFTKICNYLKKICTYFLKYAVILKNMQLLCTYAN